MLRKINFVLLILKQKHQTADWGMTNVCIQGRSSTQTPTSSCKWHTLIEAIVSLLKHKAVIVFLKVKKVGWTTKCWSCGVPSLENSVPEPCDVFWVWEAVLWEKSCQPGLVRLSLDIEVVWAGFSQGTRDRIFLVFLSWTENPYENTIIFFVNKEVLTVREILQGVLLPCGGCLAASRFLSKSGFILVIQSICSNRGNVNWVYMLRRNWICAHLLSLFSVPSVIKGIDWK